MGYYIHFESDVRYGARALDAHWFSFLAARTLLAGQGAELGYGEAGGKCKLVASSWGGSSVELRCAFPS